MKIFQLYSCPICQKELTGYHTDGNGVAAVIYECNPHYFYSQQQLTGLPIYATTSTRRFFLKYLPDETHIYKFDYDEIKKRYYKSYKYITALSGHFPLNWMNLQEADDRIQKLLIFL